MEVERASKKSQCHWHPSKYLFPIQASVLKPSCKLQDKGCSLARGKKSCESTEQLSPETAPRCQGKPLTSRGWQQTCGFGLGEWWDAHDLGILRSLPSLGTGWLARSGPVTWPLSVCFLLSKLLPWMVLSLARHRKSTRMLKAAPPSGRISIVSILLAANRWVKWQLSNVRLESWCLFGGFFVVFFSSSNLIHT